MRILICLLFVGYNFSYSIAQSKPVYISKSQEGKSIVLTAHNELAEIVKITLDIKSQGMDLSAGPTIVKSLQPNSNLKMVTLTPVPGARATYSYKISSEIIYSDPVVEQKIVQRQRNTVIKNSSKHRGKQAHENVKKNFKDTGLTIFTKDDCPRCKDLLELLKTHNIEYKLYDTSADNQNGQLMWDLLYVMGVKEGKVLMPTVIYKDEAYYDIEDLDTFVKKIATDE